MRILAVESAGKPASVAVLEDGKIVSRYFQNTGFTHSRTLLPMIDCVLKNAEIAMSEIDVFAASIGPGSFTGIRIGVSTIKGFAFAMEKPCAAVSTLEALAWNLSFTDKTICAAIDARAGNVYTALFAAAGGQLRRLSPDRAVSVIELSDELSNSCGEYILVGDGARLCYNIFTEKGISAVLSPEHLLLQDAFGVACAAYRQADEGMLLSADELSPSYLRLCQAERERIKKLEGTQQ